MFLRIERSPVSQQELTADARQTMSTGDVADDQEEEDAASVTLRDEDVDELTETADGKTSTTTVIAAAENGSTATATGSNVSSSTSALSSQSLRSSPSKSAENVITETMSVESTVGPLSISMERLPVECSSSAVPLSRSFDFSSSVHGSTTTAAKSSRTEPVHSTASSVGRITTATSSSKMAVVPPLAKKGLTHLLNSSSALFHRKRQMRTIQSDARNVVVGYSGSPVSQASTASEPSRLSDPPASLTEPDIKSHSSMQYQNSDTDVVPIVCGDVTFLMVKDDFCQKPDNLLAVDKAEDTLLSYKDAGLSSKTSTTPSTTLTDKNITATGDMVSAQSQQVSTFSLSNHLLLYLELELYLDERPACHHCMHCSISAFVLS